MRAWLRLAFGVTALGAVALVGVGAAGCSGDGDGMTSGSSGVPSSSGSSGSSGTSGSSGDTDSGSSTFAVGGSVTGLKGTGLVLSNGADTVNVTAGNGGTASFTFPAKLPSGGTYAVSVKTQPSGPTQTCNVTNGGGTIAAADVTNVAVACTTSPFKVGGTITGLKGTGLVLRNNGGDDLTVPANANTFQFATSLDSGAAYAVTVKTDPSTPNQECVVTNGTGSVGAANVASVTIACATKYYVNVGTGVNDANGGSKSAPFKNLTFALATVPAGPLEIVVAPGLYDTNAGETIPIAMKSDITLTGDVANKGKGATATEIVGAAGCAPTAGDLNGNALGCALFVPANVVNAVVRGFRISSNGQNTIVTDKATVTFASITVESSNIAIIPTNASDVTVTDSDMVTTISHPILVVDPTTKFKMRGSKVTAVGGVGAVLLGYASTFSGANIDLGTAASPGNNTILGGNGVGLRYYEGLGAKSDGTVVKAAGNTWIVSTQGSDANGKYAASLIDGSVAVPAAGGNNYAIPIAVAGSGIQF